MQTASQPWKDFERKVPKDATNKSKEWDVNWQAKKLSLFLKDTFGHVSEQNFSFGLGVTARL